MKEVKIIGLSINHQLGILHATNLHFDTNNRLTIFKGGVGDGKTTLQKSLQLGTLGQKSLTDKKLYGDVDIETQLLDGELPIWVGCKSNNNKLEFVLYSKDENGKKIANPVIDGVQATPSKYLETLQTELTWKMDELTSDNPTIQKKILLSLYKSELKKLGVIFDKSNPDYSKSILGQVEQAEKTRDYKDMKRKENGGILEDLKAKGYDPDRPGTIPSVIDLSLNEGKIKDLEKEIAVAESNSGKETKLSEIKLEAAEVTAKCIEYNQKATESNEKTTTIESSSSSIYSQINELVMHAALTNEKAIYIIDIIKQNVSIPNTEKLFITDMGKVLSYEGANQEALDLMKKLTTLRENYDKTQNEPFKSNTETQTQEIERFTKENDLATETNKIVQAVDCFLEWRESNEKVLSLKTKYVNLLADVNTGVEGLKIMPIEDDIFLMYNGKYATKYFNNEEMEYRKLSSYSGTQKPVICLLIQNYLLSRKPKALRYMYIDNIPIDNKTRILFEKMCQELELRIFLNMTGDFEKNNLKQGEILIEGGEVFFDCNLKD